MCVPDRCDDDEDCCESDDGEVECCVGLGIAGYVLKPANVTLLIVHQL